MEEDSFISYAWRMCFSVCGVRMDLMHLIRALWIICVVVGLSEASSPSQLESISFEVIDLKTQIAIDPDKDRKVVANNGKWNVRVNFMGSAEVHLLVNEQLRSISKSSPAFLCEDACLKDRYWRNGHYKIEALFVDGNGSRIDFRAMHISLVSEDDINNTAGEDYEGEAEAGNSVGSDSGGISAGILVVIVIAAVFVVCISGALAYYYFTSKQGRRRRAGEKKGSISKGNTPPPSTGGPAKETEIGTSESNGVQKAASSGATNQTNGRSSYWFSMFQRKPEEQGIYDADAYVLANEEKEGVCDDLELGSSIHDTYGRMKRYYVDGELYDDGKDFSQESNEDKPPSYHSNSLENSMSLHPNLSVSPNQQVSRAEKATVATSFKGSSKSSAVKPEGEPEMNSGCLSNNRSKGWGKKAKSAHFDLENEGHQYHSFSDVLSNGSGPYANAEYKDVNLDSIV